MFLLRQSFRWHGAAILLLAALCAAPLARGQDADAKTPADAGGLDVPQDWRPLPALAAHAHDLAVRAAGKDADVEALAWGDPASGAFALLLRVNAHAPRARHEDVHEALKEAAEAEGAHFTAWEPAAGLLRFELDWHGTRGIARGRTAVAPENGTLRAELASCFFTSREPERSAKTCLVVLDRFEETR